MVTAKEAAHQRLLRLSLEAKRTEKRARFYLQIDNWTCASLLVFSLMLAAWLYTDPYYGSKARAIRALNLTAAATQGLNESQVEFASGDPDLLNQTVMIKAPIPGPELTQVSFMRSWMNYVYENKGLVGLLMGVYVLIQFRFNEGVVRNILERFSWWTGFHILIVTAATISLMYHACSDKLTAWQVCLGIAFIGLRVATIQVMYNLHAMRLHGDYATNEPDLCDLRLDAHLAEDANNCLNFVPASKVFYNRFYNIHKPRPKLKIPVIIKY